MTPNRSLRALFLLFLGLATCAARRPPALPAVVERAVAQAPDDRAAAIETLESYLAGKPDPAVEPIAMVYAGEEHRLAGDPQKARVWFEKVAERYPTHPAKQAAVLGMALVDATGGMTGNLAATLQLIDEDGVPATMNADRYRLLAVLGKEEGTSPGKVKDYARKAAAYAEADPPVAERVKKSLRGVADSDEPAAAPDSASVALDQIRADLAAKRFSKVSEGAAALAAQWPDAPEVKTANALAKRAAAGDPVVAGKVGVLLPLTGEYSQPGTHMREAIQLANDRSGKGLQLVFMDTAGSADKALAALDDLVLKQGVVAVLGPLLKPEVEAVAAASAAYEVPLVALTQNVEPTGLGPYVFNGALTLDQQVAALADYGAQKRGFTRYAVLYPKNSYGESARAAFSKAAASRGGSVVQEIGYDPEARDFLDVARLLGQKANRSSELARLRREAEAAGQDPSKVTVPPKVEFDAIFIPDNARRASLVASALAYEEFPVGTFRPRYDQKSIALMGLNGWNSADLEEGGRYMRNCIFVDAFLPTDPGSESFVRGFESALKRKPIVVDAVAYDAARLLAAAAGEAGADRVAMRASLASTRIDGAVARGDHFGADRDVARELYVLTLSAQGIVPASTEVVLPDPEPAPQ